MGGSQDNAGRNENAYFVGTGGRFYRTFYDRKEGMEYWKSGIRLNIVYQGDTRCSVIRSPEWEEKSSAICYPRIRR